MRSNRKHPVDELDEGRSYRELKEEKGLLLSQNRKYNIPADSTVRE